MIYRYITNLYAEKVRNHLWIFIKILIRENGWATRLLNRNEAFEVEEGKSVVTVEQKIQQLYDAIFVTEYTGKVYHTILGEYEFDDNSKNFVKSVESMLSVYADYNI